MQSDLTILTVTQGEAHSIRFLNEMDRLAWDLGGTFIQHDGRGAGLLEYVLDDAVASCPDGYILLLADDEMVSHDMGLWLFAREYRAADHWAFPRRHLWPTEDTFIVTPPLWPDLQTRLSVKEKSGGLRHVHAGSPFGTGEVAPVAIDHHKFLVRTEQQRRDLLAYYETLSPSAGLPHYRAFSLPEEMPYVEVADTNVVQMEASAR